MESSKSEPALGTDKKARSSMARAGGAAKRASTVVKLSKGGKRSTTRPTRRPSSRRTSWSTSSSPSCRPGQEKSAKFPTSKAPFSASFHSFRLIFGRAIIPRNGLEAWMPFRDARARNTHVDATLNHPFPAQVPPDMLDDKTIYHINPSGLFTIGGPEGDGGLTGRKIIIDTYGGWGAHGGGAFSGKDPTKGDRSAAYYCRWIAKSGVAAGRASRAIVQVSYAIGVPEPLSVFVDTYGTGTKPDAEILEILKNNFDMRAGMLVRELDMLKPKYKKTAAYGHFGNCARGNAPDFTWEVPKKLKD